MIVEDEDNNEPDVVRMMTTCDATGKRWSSVIGKLQQHRSDLTLVERQAGYKDRNVKITKLQQEQQKFLAQRLTPK